jgi:hypothetical protein
MMTAIYRVVVQGWSKQEAVNEMVQGGFGYHPLWHNLVSRVEELDTAAIKQQLDALPRAQ